MQIHDEHTWIEGVPVRLCHGGDPGGAGARGTVLFYHGLSAAIAGQTKELHGLARAGFLAVGVDAVGHGARRWPDFDSRLSGPGTEEAFQGIVRDSVAEIPRLIDALLERGWAVEGKIGLGGISMGGFIAYAAVPAEPRIRVLTPILGSPVLGEDREDSPHRRPEAFAPVALLAQNAGRDRNVPPDAARDFHERLRPCFSGSPERLGYVEFDDCEHFMPEDRWEELWANVVQWYQRFL